MEQNIEARIRPTELSPTDFEKNVRAIKWRKNNLSTSDTRANDIHRQKTEH